MVLSEKMVRATRKEPVDRVFFYAPRHVDDYHKKHAKSDIRNFGPTRHLIVKDENGRQESFTYTHTTLAPMDADLEAIKKDHQIDDARLVWHGPESQVVFFGVKAQMPTVSRQKTIS